MKITLLANDVLPGMGLPVAAPGMRAWGLAIGLRSAGHDVNVLVDERVAMLAWRTRPRQMPPATPRGVALVRTADVGSWVRAHGSDALVVTNSNHIGVLGDLGRCKLVYDFFAPKVLELAEQATPEEREERVARLSASKLAGLARSDYVIVNGEKKVPYVRDWLTRAGRADMPLAVVNMALPPMRPRPVQDGRIHAIVSGYLQPWSRIGPWLSAMRPFLYDGSMILHVLLGSHWGQEEGVPLPRELREVLSTEAATAHGSMTFDDFRTLMSRCHVNVDVFERNDERELAMVTRSVTALSCGVPTVHVPFTEVSPLIERYDAGWLVEEDDLGQMTTAFEQSLDPEILAGKRSGAERLAAEVFDPTVAVVPLVKMLEGDIDG